MPNVVREKSRPVKPEPESPWKQKLKKSNKEELISFLKPPKAAKDEYKSQTPSKYVFKCRDGDIQIPEYGIRRTDFYYKQSKAREIDEENGNIFNYQEFPRLGLFQNCLCSASERRIRNPIMILSSGISYPG